MRYQEATKKMIGFNFWMVKNTMKKYFLDSSLKFPLLLSFKLIPMSLKKDASFDLGVCGN